MSSITLNRKEVAVLKGAIRRGEHDTGFQEFLTVLDDLLNAETGVIHISDTTLNTISRYTSVVNKPSWYGILFSIFGRVLPAAFGDAMPGTNLIDINRGRHLQPVPENGSRHSFVV